MPTYVYKREDGTIFEIVQRITENALETDPETGQKVRRIPSKGAGLLFKGTGFYLTDYNSREGTDKAEPAPPKADAPAGTSASSETKGDTPKGDATKPAAPAAPSPAPAAPAPVAPKSDAPKTSP